MRTKDLLEDVEKLLASVKQNKQKKVREGGGREEGEENVQVRREPGSEGRQKANSHATSASEKPLSVGACLRSTKFFCVLGMVRTRVSTHCVVA